MSFMYFHPRCLCIPTPKPTGEKIAKCLEKTNKLQNAVSFIFKVSFCQFLYKPCPRGDVKDAIPFICLCNFQGGIQQLRGQNFATLRGQFLYHERGQKHTFFDPPPPSCPRSY